MADFKKTLLDQDKLIKAFEDLSITDAMVVKENLNAAMPHLKAISKELAEMLAKENIDLSALSGDKKPRKKRVAVLENQKFCKEDGKLKLLITRAISVAEKAGHEILSFSDLKGADIKDAERLVSEYNA
jgi:translation initiation factor 2 gamma subunit (eIF-2gamma)